MQETRGFYFLFGAWLISLVSSLGSLFFSEIMGFPPCALCWYQRITMYPLTLVLLAGLFPLDRKVINFSMPLALIGWVLALYHNLLHWGVLPQEASPCQKGVSCSTVYMEILGFITIPLLSFVAFSVLVVLLWLFYKKQREEV